MQLDGIEESPNDGHGTKAKAKTKAKKHKGALARLWESLHCTDSNTKIGAALQAKLEALYLHS